MRREIVTVMEKNVTETVDFNIPEDPKVDILTKILEEIKSTRKSAGDTWELKSFQYGV